VYKSEHFVHIYTPAVFIFNKEKMVLYGEVLSGVQYSICAGFIKFFASSLSNQAHRSTSGKLSHLPEPLGYSIS
jgi:hypothetical protein